ncbi:hypothetical protein [Modestobacter sp. VKM Ac-2984]|uniref:hypothetical protein n=1 Tax=Modestobacter sp. VKM Ac-2984 TaxID=3004138 RepID=UPI0022AB4B10|nr:hypothetical protein [Modestobacter sp. VKM Ac-2984]MCZ2817899.1 hypothetical protein [Modestobacter sp. VKM Ac-2984]
MGTPGVTTVTKRYVVGRPFVSVWFGRPIPTVASAGSATALDEPAAQPAVIDALERALVRAAGAG